MNEDIDITEAIAKLPTESKFVRVTRVYYDPVNDHPRISVRAVVVSSDPAVTSQVVILQVFDSVREATLCCELVGDHIKVVRRLST